MTKLYYDNRQNRHSCCTPKDKSKGDNKIDYIVEILENILSLLDKDSNKFSNSIVRKNDKKRN